MPSSSPASCRISPRRLAALQLGDAPRWNVRARRLARHVAGCPACEQELRTGRRAAELARRGLEDLVRTEMAEFRSIRTAVRARLASRPAAAAPVVLPRRAPSWSLALPAAAVMAGLTVLILRPNVDEGRGRPAGASTSAPASGPTVEMSSTVDGVVRLELTEPAAEPHRVAVSTRAWDFSKAAVFEIEGRSWVDPMPDPPSGQAYFYRVD